MKKTLLLLCLILYVMAVACSDDDGPGAANLGLASLSVSEGALVPAFDTAVTNYTVSVGNAVTAITVTALPADTNAAVVSFDPAQPAALAVGTNVIRVHVVKLDGSRTNTCTVTVLRVATNAALAALSVDAGTLAPAFDPAVTEYRIPVYLSNSIATVAFTAAAAHPGATVSYPAGQPAALSAGSNMLTVRVTAEDGVTVRDYRIRVYRMEAPLVSATVGTLLPVPAGTFQRDGTAANTSYVSACRMSRTEVTRAQYSNVMLYDPSDPAWSSGTGDPVMKVTWYDAVEFCNKLSQQEGLTPVYTIENRLPASGYPVTNATVTVADWNADGYRLPTEMEWLWAAMGGNMGGDPFAVNTTGRLKDFSGDNGSRTIEQCAWYGSQLKTAAAGSLLPNELGFVDLSGNVSEWLWDWMAYSGAQDNYAISGHVVDHRGGETGTNRVLRGGSWTRPASECMLATRGSVPPHDFSVNWGFRVVRP